MAIAVATCLCETEHYGLSYTFTLVACRPLLVFVVVFIGPPSCTTFRVRDCLKWSGPVLVRGASGVPWVFEVL